MTHDVFISYSNEDKNIADAVCNNLERKGMRCWIAPRDVLPGRNYGESIVDAIKEAEVLVLILSAYSNQSAYVMREVERAVNSGTNIIPFRVEDVVPSKQLEFFISSAQWQDALTPPLEAHIDSLAQTVGKLLNKSAPSNIGVQNYVKPQSGTRRNIQSRPTPPRRSQQPNIPKKSSNRNLIIGAGAVGILILIGLVIFVNGVSATNKTYSDNGISFEYNGSWESSDDLSSSEIVKVYDPTNNNNDLYDGILAVYEYNSSGTTLKQMVNNDYQYISKNSSNSIMNNITTEELGNETAYAFAYTHDTDGYQLDSVSAWVEKNGLIYNLYFSALDSEWQTEVKNFKIIEESFAFT